jgi:hypothetical protein
VINAQPVEAEALLQKGLEAQRNWIARGGIERARPSLQRRAKGWLAYLVSRVVVGFLYVIAVLVLLLLLRQKWPWLDVYEALRWLQRTLPGLFPPS